jgi:hydrogenase maturation factor
LEGYCEIETGANPVNRENAKEIFVVMMGFIVKGTVAASVESLGTMVICNKTITIRASSILRNFVVGRAEGGFNKFS